MSFVLDQILKRFMGGILPLCWQGLGQLAGVSCQTVKGLESETSLHHVPQRKLCNKGIEAAQDLPGPAECEAILWGLGGGT